MDRQHKTKPHCFVCHRHTDHVGEHDDMVAAGRAIYVPEHGAVYEIDPHGR